MTNEEALELLKDTNLLLRCSFTGDIRIVEAIDMAIKALGKDTNVPSKSALDHIYNVVRDDAYRRGYEQGKADAKADAIPVDWIEAEIKRLRDMDNGFASLSAGQIETMMRRWREEQNNGQTD